MADVTSFQLSYQVSPITLVGGIAQNVSGGMIPIVSLLQSQDYDQGLLSQSSPTSLDDYFATFTVVDADTLVKNEISHWPLANLVVAANNVIADPNTVSLLMTCPGQVQVGGVSYAGKLAVMTALKASLDQHTAAGGWYNVSTPAYLYQGCLLMSVRNVSRVASGQVQFQYLWEFEQPLITVAAAQGAQNTQMAKLSSQTQMSGDPPGSGPAAASVGKPSSNVASSLIPAAKSTPSATAVPTASVANANVAAVSPIPPGS